MGRPKKGVTETESEGTLYEDMPEDLAEVFDALPGEDKVISLFRIQPSGPPAFLTTLSPDGLRNLSIIQGEYGGGKYKAVAKNYETSQKVERGFSIEGDPKVRGDKVITHDPKTGFFIPKSEWRKEPGYEENNNSSDAISRFYERQLDRLEAENERLKDQKPGSGNGVAEALQLLIQAKELIAPQPVNQSAMDTNVLFSALTKGMDMVSDRDRENGQPAWISVVKELMPEVQKIISRVTIPVKPSGQPNLPPKDVTPATGFQSLLPMLEPFKETFINAASTDDDPSLLIPLVVKRILPEKGETIKWIQDGKWFDDLVSLDQRISFQRGWWEEFMRGLLAELTGKGEKPEEQEEQAT